MFGARAVLEFVQREWPVDTSFPIVMNGPTSWSPNAKLRVKQIAVGEGVDSRPLERVLAADAIKFEACHVQHVGVRGKQRLRYRLRFAADGELSAVDRLAGSLGSVAADGCIAAVLLGGRWDQAAIRAAAVEVELQLGLR